MTPDATVAARIGPAAEQLPKPPKHLTRAGKKLFRDLCREYVFDAASLVLLTAACEQMDVYRAAQAEVKKHGLVVGGTEGQMLREPRREVGPRRTPAGAPDPEATLSRLTGRQPMTLRRTRQKRAESGEAADLTDLDLLELLELVLGPYTPGESDFPSETERERQYRRHRSALLAQEGNSVAWAVRHYEPQHPACHEAARQKTRTERQ